MADGYTMDPVTGSQSLYDEQIQFLQKLWGNSVDPWCVKEPNDKFIFANDAYLDFLGVPAGTSVAGVLEKKLIASLDGFQSIDLYSYKTNPSVFTPHQRSSFILRSKNRDSKCVKFLYLDKYPILDSKGKIYAICFHGRYDFLLSLSMFHHRSGVSRVKTVRPSDALLNESGRFFIFYSKDSTEPRSLSY